jgi:hypothetical protein
MLLVLFCAPVVQYVMTSYKEGNICLINPTSIVDTWQ